MQNNKTATGKLWRIEKSAPESIFDVLDQYPKVIAQLLYNRGIKTKKEAEQFFNPDYDKDLLDPFLIYDLKKATERIIKAAENKERIVIYHDYDADGVCGSVILASTLKELGVSFKTYTPDRQKEGYGLNKSAILDLVKNGVDLLITVDCGITNAQEVDILNDNNVDVIIVDHHIQSDVLPKAFAVVNPKQKACGYEFKDLCAAAVVFKLCSALLHSDFGKKRGIKNGFEKWLLDLVATATIADMMPLLGENRTLVKYGLLVVKKTKRPGLKKLILESEKFKNGVDSTFLAFQVAPKINATSRMTHASVSYELLSTESEKKAEELFLLVKKANDDRRKFVEEATKEAIFWIEKDAERKGKLDDVIVIGDDKWTPGIVGLVASKITEKYARPSFVYGRVGNVFKGSCRGVDGFDIVNAMSECAKKDKSIFKAFGGHKGAGGFSIYEKKIDDFKKLIIEVSEPKLRSLKLEPTLKIEAKVLPEDINWETLDFLLKFEPFGQKNPKPLLFSEGLEISDIKIVGNGSKHLKLKLKAKTQDRKLKFFDAVGFGLGDFYEKIKKGDKMDIVFEMDANEWQGRKELQLNIRDLRLTYNDIN